MLYNAPVTMENHYAAQSNSDLHGDGWQKYDQVQQFSNEIRRLFTICRVAFAQQRLQFRPSQQFDRQGLDNGGGKQSSGNCLVFQTFTL